MKPGIVVLLALSLALVTAPAHAAKSASCPKVVFAKENANHVEYQATKIKVAGVGCSAAKAVVKHATKYKIEAGVGPYYKVKGYSCKAKQDTKNTADGGSLWTCKKVGSKITFRSNYSKLPDTVAPPA